MDIATKWKCSCDHVQSCFRAYCISVWGGAGCRQVHGQGARLWMVQDVLFDELTIANKHSEQVNYSKHFMYTNHLILMTDPERLFSSFIPLLGWEQLLWASGSMHLPLECWYSPLRLWALGRISTYDWASFPPLLFLYHSESPPWPQSTCPIVVNSSVYSQGP